MRTFPLRAPRELALPAALAAHPIRIGRPCVMRAAGKVVLQKTANRECIGRNAEFRPQRTTLSARSESRTGNSRDISAGWRNVKKSAKCFIYNDKTVAEPEGFEPSIRLFNRITV